MKKFAIFCISIVMLLSLGAGVQAEAHPVTIWLQEQEVDFQESDPVLERGTTYVPVTFLEALGFSYEWDQDTGQVTGTVSVNDEVCILNTDAALMNRSPYIPLRQAAELAGYTVTWNQAQKAVYLSKPEEDAATAASRGFFWRLGDEDDTIYLLGSIHVADETLYPLREDMQGGFEESDMLAVEVNIAETVSPQLQQYVAERSAYSDGTTLPDHISEETYAKLAAILEENGLPAQAMDPFKPWSVSTTIDYLTYLKQGYSSEYGIDSHFIQQALERGMAIQELESFEFQLEMFDSFSPALQEELLRSSIEAYLKGKDHEFGIDAMNRMWIEGDEEQLLAMIQKTAEQPELYKAMIEERNYGMVEKLLGFLHDDEGHTCFVIVGAAHMIGEHGLVPLLEEAGYDVIRQ